jgi:SWI/SNF-related matrix-associated actin-dependent regulator 1 of chromatin subfamily A
MSDDYDDVFAALEAYESRRGSSAAAAPRPQQQQQQWQQQQAAPSAPPSAPPTSALPPAAAPPPAPAYQQQQWQPQPPAYQQQQWGQQQPQQPPWAGAAAAAAAAGGAPPPPPPQQPPPPLGAAAAPAAPVVPSVRQLFAGPAHFQPQQQQQYQHQQYPYQQQPQPPPPPSAAVAGGPPSPWPPPPPPHAYQQQQYPPQQQQQYQHQPPYPQQPQQQPHPWQQQPQQQQPPVPPPPPQQQQDHPPPPPPNLAYRAELALTEGARLAVTFSGFHERLFASLAAVPGAQRQGGHQQPGGAAASGGGGWQRTWSFPLSELPAVREASSSIPNLTVTFSDLPPLVGGALEAARRLPDDSGRFSRLDELQLGAAAGDTLATRLMPFQRAGVRFALSRGGRALIGDEMGLGKTAQACALLLAYADEWPALVVVPSSLRDQWADALYGWLRVTEDRMLVAYKERDLDALDPFLAAARQAAVAAEARLRQQGGRVTAAAAAAARSEAEAGTFRNKCPFDVVVVSYDLMSREDKSGRLKACHFAVAAFDEAHYLKTPKSLRTKAAVPLAQGARRLFLLSGTPVTSRPAELMPLMQMLLPDARITMAQFADRYCQGNQW